MHAILVISQNTRYHTFRNSLLPVLPHHQLDRQSLLLPLPTTQHTSKRDMAKQEVAGKFVLNPQDILALNGSFAVADKNKDGQLDFPEFVALFTSKGITDQAELKLWFDCFDTDHSGKISAKEFISALTLIGKGTQQQKLAFLFDLFDTDKSGSLTHTEINSIVAYIKRVVTDFGEGEIVANKINVNSLDANKDGKISKEEFVAYGLKNPNITNALNWKFSK